MRHCRLLLGSAKATRAGCGADPRTKLGLDAPSFGEVAFGAPHHALRQVAGEALVRRRESVTLLGRSFGTIPARPRSRAVQRLRAGRPGKQRPRDIAEERRRMPGVLPLEAY